MPFPMKIQPVDFDNQKPFRIEQAKPVLKSRLKRLFDRQFRVSSTDKLSVSDQTQLDKDGAYEFEPGSVCLAKMVQNYIEESNEKQQLRGRNRCNCFNRNANDSSDDEFDPFGDSINGGSLADDACELLKALVPCPTVAERTLLANTATIVELENNKNHKRKDDLRKIVIDTLSSIGYNSSLCKSKWDKSPSSAAGEYDYIDVIVEEERFIIDIDFRSEFEIARSTNSYKTILQSIPYIFVGKPDRLSQIVAIVSDAAKQSLKKKGMHIPPWRKAEYMRSKWLSPFTKSIAVEETKVEIHDFSIEPLNGVVEKKALSECGELELIFGEEIPTEATAVSESSAIKPFCYSPMRKPSVTGLASLLSEKQEQ